MLLASESESERWNLPLFTDSSLLQPQADGAQEWVQRDEKALLLSSAYWSKDVKKQKKYIFKKRYSKKLETFSSNFHFL